jgi:hypothetical protein
MGNTSEFRITRNGIKVVTQNMVDYSALMRNLDALKVTYYTFHPKSLKPMKAVILQLRGDTPDDDISIEIVTLSYSVISVRQMKAVRLQPQGGLQTFSTSLLLVAFMRNGEALEIFKLTNLRYAKEKFLRRKVQ